MIKEEAINEHPREDSMYSVCKGIFYTKKELCYHSLVLYLKETSKFKESSVNISAKKTIPEASSEGMNHLRTAELPINTTEVTENCYMNVT